MPSLVYLMRLAGTFFPLILAETLPLTIVIEIVSSS